MSRSIAVWRALRDPALPKWARWLPLLALAYVVSPVDLVPDLVPVVGWIDDLGVGAATLAATLGLVLRHAESLRAPAGRAPTRTGSGRSDRA